MYTTRTVIIILLLMRFLFYLRNFPRLKEISLNACWQLTTHGVLQLLEKLPYLQSVKFKINSGLLLNDIRSEYAMSEGLNIIQAVAESRFAELVTVLCIHYVPIEMDELWDLVKKFSRLKKLCISNCEVGLFFSYSIESGKTLLIIGHSISFSFFVLTKILS